MRAFPSFVLITCLLTLCAHISAAQCNKHFPLTKGTTYEITHYSADNIKTGSADYEVKEIASKAWGLEAVVNYTTYDGSAKKSNTDSFKLICEGDILKIKEDSSRSPLNNNMELQVVRGPLETPLNLSVGQQLKDAVITTKMVDMKTNAQISKTTLYLTDRKVEGTEKITTPAGTFDTYKTSTIQRTESDFNGEVTQKVRRIVEYRAKDTGLVVKREDYNNSGKLEAYKLLTRFKK